LDGPGNGSTSTRLSHLLRGTSPASPDPGERPGEPTKRNPIPSRSPVRRLRPAASPERERTRLLRRTGHLSRQRIAGNGQPRESARRLRGEAQVRPVHDDQLVRAIPSILPTRCSTLPLAKLRILLANRSAICPGDGCWSE